MRLFFSTLLFLTLVSFNLQAQADGLHDIQLNSPELNQSGTLMNALKTRHSSREYANKDLTLQELSNLLWAAAGINRDDEKKRTFPSAMNKQSIDIYVVDRNGIYLYDFINNKLIQKMKGDYRSKTGTQPFVAEAPINLVFVADLSRFNDRVKNEAEQLNWATLDAGFISENAYLYCANNKLATVVRGSIQKNELALIMGLNSNQRIILAQSVGYEK